MSGRTQAMLYAKIDHELSWSERDLPQHQRTKHVHRLHPYLGKFVPQLAETLLRRSLTAGAVVYDPFAGSGTTLVEANALGIHAIGADVSAFNCLLMRVKVEQHDLAVLRDDLDRALAAPPADPPPSEWLARWYAPDALRELAGFCATVDGSAEAETLMVVASRAARSARLAAHHDLDMPRIPVHEPYACHKHRRTCRPVERADHFLRRYADDTVQRLAEFDALRTPAGVAVVHADARTADLPDRIDGIVTSPPYPGLIDYHEQHRYAYELLRLDDRRELELGAAAAGTARRAIDAYCEGIAEALARARPRLSPGANAAIVVNDRRDLYDGIARRAGYTIARRDVRHVNRRTGRRAGEYFEQILWLRPRPAGPAA
ncbi:MAG TPA: DNA methyltransferase [Gaiellales bacterium]|nr:DNA methyltransferase [Gaiellales bacterium]